jgi:hypothetical protein
MTLHLAGDRDISPRRDHDWTRTVHHGGRSYIATATMAAIFASHANDAIIRGETELVPLLHRDGVDLLLITPTTAFAVVGIELGVTRGRIRGRRDTGAQPYRPAS